MWHELHTSLRLRLALVFVGGSLTALLAVSGFLYWAFQREINLRNRALLEEKVQELATLVRQRPQDLPSLERELRAESQEGSESRAFLRVLNGTRTLTETPGMAERLPPTWFTGQPKTKRKHRRFMLAQHGEGSFLVQGALEITEDERMILGYRRRLFYTLLGAALSCAAFGAWATHRGLLPLRAIAQSTRGITAHRLSERLDPGKVPQELQELVRALNDMLDRLDRAFSRLSQCSADLAHELRTPITNLMGEAEVALSRDRSAEDYRQVLESSLEEYRRLSRLIGRLLFLARVEDPRAALVSVPVDARQLVGDVLAFFAAQAGEGGVALQSEVHLDLRGDPELLRQALANLVANALEATPPGGSIQVRVLPEGDRVRLEVQDTGRGIPAAELPHLLDRFYRTQGALQRKAPGTGLGLAIVHSIAHLHGGNLTLASQPGVGTTATLWL